MTAAARIAAPVFLIFMILCFVALALTGLTLVKVSMECQHNGGTFSVEGGTAWCRY